MDFEWYPWKFRLYRRDTAHLTLAAHGAYRALIDAYMADVSGPLPDNDRALAILARCTHEEFLSIKGEVLPFFTSKNGKLWHKRCEAELDAVHRRAKSRSESGKKAAAERWRDNNDLDATRIRDACEPHTERMPIAMRFDATGTGTETGIERPVHEDSLAKTKNSRGSRLPEGWTLDDELKKWTLDQAVPPDRIPEIEASFRDYWHAKTGPNATKRDWAATWRNWIRKEKANGSGHHTAPRKQSPHQTLFSAAAALSRRIQKPPDLR